MNAKKALTLGLISTLISSSYFSSYALTKDYSSYYNNSKTQKLIKLNENLEKYITSDTNKKVSSFKNVALKSGYKKEIWEITNNLKKLNSTLKYSYDYNFTNNLSLVKEQAQAYKILKSEIEAAVKKGLNPYKITSEEQNRVEQDIISVQKDIISGLKTYIDKYSDSDFKETWKASFEISSTLWKVSVNVEKYTNIFSILRGSQESDFKIKINFEWNLPGKSTYKNGKYTKWESVKVSWNISLDANIKIIDKDLYLNLRDYKISVQTSDKTMNMDSQIKSVTQTLDKYKGKSIHIELPKTNQVNQAEAIKKLKTILDILETNSLLTPFKKINNTYSLILKKDTIDKIWTEVDGSKSNISASYKEILKYSNDNSKITLFKEISEKWMKWKVSLTKQNSSYIIEWNLAKWSDVALFTIKNNYINLKTNSSSVSSSLVWENNALNLTVSQNNKQILSIKWALSLDKTDLKINYNSQDIGTIKSTKKDNNYTYEIKLNLKDIIPDNDISVNFTWEYNLETGKFDIVAPKDVIEMEDPYTAQINKARDSTRMSNIMILQSWLEMSYQDQGEYPKSLNDLSSTYILNKPKDTIDWQTINGCKFWYIYKVSSDKNGIKNQKYTLSTCFEDKENIEKKAKNDWGTDSLRWEVKSY
ncbi:MAG: hypothetical protein ACD_49C00062G0009 [uncultured bacterium (gcode 4)]|uniref:Uncharacterized protein n=1 Tax=uncultured bacterium (gcode 4) TaxID=1234023 RepID=K2ADQ6_9BACT|nr:MAG: hypothetical protein ACD_49C00062G0009 [uncultured bacterium (gcode 4)]